MARVLGGAVWLFSVSQAVPKACICQHQREHQPRHAHAHHARRVLPEIGSIKGRTHRPSSADAMSFSGTRGGAGVARTRRRLVQRGRPPSVDAGVPQAADSDGICFTHGNAVRSRRRYNRFLCYAAQRKRKTSITKEGEAGSTQSP